MWNYGPSFWTWLIDSNQCLVLSWTIEKGKREWYHLPASPCIDRNYNMAPLYYCSAHFSNNRQLQAFHLLSTFYSINLNMCLSLFMFSSFHWNVSSFKSCCVPLPSQCTSRKKAVSHIPVPQVTLRGPSLKKPDARRLDQRLDQKKNWLKTKKMKLQELMNLIFTISFQIHATPLPQDTGSYSWHSGRT